MFRKYSWGITLAFLIFISLNLFCRFIEKEDPIMKGNVSDIKIDTTMHVLNVEVAVHNKALIDFLKQRSAIQNSNLASSTSIKMQFRAFYITILAGLSALLFSTRISDNTKSKVIRRILLIMMIAMYLLEVHFNDLYTRENDVEKFTEASMNSLLRLKPNDSTWYDLTKWNTSDSNSVASEWKKVSGSTDTHSGTKDRFSKTTEIWWRKIKASLSPDPEQMVYYLFPWVVLFYYPCFQTYHVETRFKRKYGSQRSKDS